VIEDTLFDVAAESRTALCEMRALNFRFLERM